MQVELSQEERKTIHRALEVYMSDLRHEIVKTEKHEVRVELHAEEETLKRLLSKLAE